MKALNVTASILALLIVSPIWYYLLYQVLTRVNATELMWFLYWIYLPAAILMGVLTRVVATAEKKSGA